jgi:hypothetical protein
VAQAMAQRPAATRLTENLAATALCLGLVWSIFIQSGRIADNQGLGYDGKVYAEMVSMGLYRGVDNQRVRPTVLLINQLAYDAFFRDVIRTFQAMHFVYAAMLAIVLCAILDVHAVSFAHKLVFLLNVFATIAVTKMFAFYPVLIDSGAYAFVALALYAVLTGKRGFIAAAAVAAMGARELALAPVLFGIHRDLRTRVPPLVTLATYGPALAGYVALRQWVAATTMSDQSLAPAAGGRLWSLGEMIANAGSLVGPSYLLFFAYFAVTVLGGISLLLVLRGLRGAIPLRGETEWVTYLLAIGVLTFVGPDLWRYLVYALPAAAVFYARAVAREDWRPVAGWAAAVTLFTQQPWTAMTDATYFQDWFPLYLTLSGIPAPPTAQFWVAWAIRIGGVICLACVMWVALRPVPAPSRTGLSTLAV